MTAENQEQPQMEQPQMEQPQTEQMEQLQMEQVIEPIAIMETEPLSPQEMVQEMVQPPRPISRKNTILEELKHSVQMHVILMNGMTKQLGQFLLKTLDFVEDTNFVRRDKEIAKLSYVIVESLAVFVHQSIDDRAQKAEQQGLNFPTRVRQAGDNLLVVIGKTRSSTDMINSKNIVLRAIADALRELSGYTKAKYPDITDSQRNEL